MSVVFPYTRDMDPKYGYAISASTIGVLFILSLFLVKEPTDKKIEKPSLKVLCSLIKRGSYTLVTNKEMIFGYLLLIICK